MKHLKLVTVAMLIAATQAMAESTDNSPAIITATADITSIDEFPKVDQTKPGAVPLPPIRPLDLTERAASRATQNAL